MAEATAAAARVEALEARQNPLARIGEAGGADLDGRAGSRGSMVPGGWQRHLW